MGHWLLDCLWPSVSCMWLSVELPGISGPDGFSCDLPKFGAGGLCVPSAGPVQCPVGLGMDGCSSLIGTVSSEMLAAIFFSDVESLGCMSVCWEGWLSGPLSLEGRSS